MSHSEKKRAKMEEGSPTEKHTEDTLSETVPIFSKAEFSEVVQCKAFVDKSLFIKAFFKEVDEPVVVFAPKRFGKTTNMSMLHEFLNGNKELFQNNQLKIWKEERFFFDKYCVKNPVIYADFKNIGGNTEEKFLESLQMLIHTAFMEHQYLVKEVDGKYSWSEPRMEIMGDITNFEAYWKNFKSLSENDVIFGLQCLSECLHVYHNKKVYVLIDEYDHPIVDMVMDSDAESGHLKFMIKIIGRMISALLKTNKCIARALLNASVHIAQMLSGNANNMLYRYFLRNSSLSRYFGFTDTEVKTLFEKDEFAPFKHGVETWYDGYTCTKTKEFRIYSCYSILNYLENSVRENKPQFETYWVGSTWMKEMDELIVHPLIHERVQNLIKEGEIEINWVEKFQKKDILQLKDMIGQKLNSVDDDEVDLFLQFLTENGYANIQSVEANNKVVIEIPNNEIRNLLLAKCYNIRFYKREYRFEPRSIANYKTTLQSMLKQDDENACIEYANAVSDLFRFKMPENESEFHSILYALAACQGKWTVKSELHVSRRNSVTLGRPPRLDLLTIIENRGVIMELKFNNQSSAKAYSQIISNKYETGFDNFENLTKKILLGLHMTTDSRVHVTWSSNNSPEVKTVTNNE